MSPHEAVGSASSGPSDTADVIAMKRLGDLALFAQDACNLSGVVHSFSQVMTLLWAEADRTKQGTTWVNTHPVAVLFASKVASLTGCEQSGTFSRAYAACHALAKTGVLPGAPPNEMQPQPLPGFDHAANCQSRAL